MKQIFNTEDTKAFRKSLRENLTPAEAFLWNHLKARKLNGKKFRRQHSIGIYTVDFYCAEEKLAVELDGQPHFEIGADLKMEVRELYLEKQGVRVIHFENKDVFERTGWVLETISDLFTQPPLSSVP
jgi:very-short-patch-repair endonuclease